MTVKELRHLLFDVENQDATVEIVTSVSHGRVKTTVGIGGLASTPKGIVEEIPKNIVLLNRD